MNETGKKKRFLTTTAAADAVWLRSRLLLLFGVFIFLVACTALSPDDFCFFSSFLIFFLSRLNKKNSPGRQPAPAHAAKREGGGGNNNKELTMANWKVKKKEEEEEETVTTYQRGESWFVRSFVHKWNNNSKQHQEEGEEESKVNNTYPSNYTPHILLSF